MITAYDLSVAGFCMWNPSHRAESAPMPLSTHEVTITDDPEPPTVITCCEACATKYKTVWPSVVSVRKLGAAEA